MAKLTKSTRSAIPTSKFALPGRRYPIQDAGHRRAAEIDVHKYGTPGEIATVDRRVKALMPGK